MPEKQSYAEQFDRDGLVFIKGLLFPEEAKEYKTQIRQLSGMDDDFDIKQARTKDWSLPDGVTKVQQCWPLIWHPKLLGVLRNAVGDEVRYTQHSDLHVHHGISG